MPNHGDPPSRTSAHDARGILSNLRVVSLTTLLSRILGMARDMAMAGLFGAGTTLDAFIVAFRLPNLARQLFGEGALTVAFLPVFQKERQEHGDLAARSTFSAVYVCLASTLIAIVACLELLIGAYLWSTTAEPSTTLLLTLLMLMLPYLVCICLAALASAALHSMRQFFWPAMVPVVLNALWLIGAWGTWLATDAGEQETRAKLLAGVVTIAGVGQLLLPLSVLQRQGMGLVRSWRTGLPQVRRVVVTMGPVVAGMAVVQCNAVLDSLLAWGLARPETGGPAWCESIGIPPLLEAGTAAALYLGQRMYQFPLGVFGIALATVLFPVLTQHAQREEWDLLRADLSRGLRIVIAIALPASAGLVVLAGPIAMTLFRHGEFSQQDAQLTARMIAIYGGGTWCYISLSILNRAFYAIGDRMTPMRYGLMALILNVPLNLLLAWFLGGIGLALGSVLACFLQVSLTYLKLTGQVGKIHAAQFSGTLLRGAIATAVMTAAAVGVLFALPDGPDLLQRVARLLLPCLTGVVAYFVAARLLGLRELEELLHRNDQT